MWFSCTVARFVTFVFIDVVEFYRNSPEKAVKVAIIPFVASIRSLNSFISLLRVPATRSGLDENIYV